MGRVIALDDYRPQPSVLDGLLCDVDDDGLVTFFTREWAEQIIREELEKMGEKA
jgi:hypothetical protein